MSRLHGIFRLLLALAGLCFVSGASTAAVACVAPQMQMMQADPMKDCPAMPKAKDHGAVCTPMCVAIQARVARISPVPIIASLPVPGDDQSAVLKLFGPDPPPPRAG